MDAISEPFIGTGAFREPDSALAREIDRWIFVLMAASFVLIALLGFIPDSVAKIAAVHAGERAPFPAILHVHAVLMGSFLLLLLTQTALAATGNIQQHRHLGMLGAALVPMIVITGLLLVPTMYQQVWSAAQTAPPEARASMLQNVSIRDSIMLLQLRMGILFPLFMTIALVARTGDPALHKRMMILATAIILPPAIDRITWLPSTFPASPLGTDFYTVLAILPMLVWDLVRNRRIPKAYVVWLAINLPFAVVVHALWDSAWWHAVAPRLAMV